MKRCHTVARRAGCGHIDDDLAQDFFLDRRDGRQALCTAVVCPGRSPDRDRQPIQAAGFSPGCAQADELTKEDHKGKDQQKRRHIEHAAGAVFQDRWLAGCVVLTHDSIA